MSIAYIDSPSGAGGDMILAALIDAGLDAPELERRLASLPIAPFRIVAEKRVRSGIGATGVRIHTEGEPRARGFSRIAAAIDEADPPEGGRS